MYSQLQSTIENIEIQHITDSRKAELEVLVNYIQFRKTDKLPVDLNFICTHNSRRSHLTQIWAQTMARFYELNDVHCYSGGTEATAMFPKVAETLQLQGFKIKSISSHDEQNPIYAIRSGENEIPILGFSKTFDHFFNPKSEFGAVMTCSSADANCPFIPNATRISLTYKDPKHSDGSDSQDEVYALTSILIATEMKYVFSSIY